MGAVAGEVAGRGRPVEGEQQLPTRCAGTWDPHLALIDGHWHVAFVAARKYFSFYPALPAPRSPAGSRRSSCWEQPRTGARRRGR